jgi:preprotein translocase subunit SecE
LVERRTPNPRVGGSNPSWPEELVRGGLVNKIVDFFKEVRLEIEKISWPKWNDLVGSVVIVCFLSVFFAVVVGLMDFMVSYGITWVIS